MSDHAPDAVRDRIGLLKKPTCALCGRAVTSFKSTLEPTRDGHYDVKFEVECCGCYEMVRLRGTCCQEITALAIGIAFANHPHARISRIEVVQ